MITTAFALSANNFFQYFWMSQKYFEELDNLINLNFVKYTTLERKKKQYTQGRLAI